MDFRKSFHRLLAAALVAVAVMSWVAPAQQAFAVTAEYPEPFRIWWRPTFGDVTTGPAPTGSSYQRRVNMYFQWDFGIAIRRLDAPRTPFHRGSYEHQLQFNETSGVTKHWCDGSPNQTYTDLPDPHYWDRLHDDGEFAWGMAAYAIVANRQYGVEFECNPSSENLPSDTSYSLKAQIGHEHCGYASECVYSDETNTLIPSQAGTAGGGSGNYFFETFAWNYSGGATFEAGTDPWSTVNATKTQQCDSAKAYEGSCFLRVNPSAGNTGAVRYTHAPAVAAVVSKTGVYHEAVVRCPTYWNGDGCKLDLEIKGLDANGNETFESSANLNVPVANDDSWKAIRTKVEDFSTATKQWRFIIRGGTNDVFNVDFNEQWYLRPAP